MVAAVPQAAASSDKNALNHSRPPLLPDQQQQNGHHIATPRKPRGKQVPSRYLSPSPSSSSSSSSTTTTIATNSTSSSSTTTTNSSFSKRFPSPLLSRSTNSSLSHAQTTPKRSQSVGRRRAVAGTAQSPGIYQANTSEMSAATKVLITSTRSLSVSFQGEAFSLPISKAKAKAMSQQNVGRKMTPERRRATPVRDQGENSRPLDQHRWPGRSREGNSKTALLSRSLDCSIGSGPKIGVIESGLVGIKSLQQSMMVVSGDQSSGRLSLELGNVGDAVTKKNHNSDGAVGNDSCLINDLTASDSDSVSSGSTSGVQEFGGTGRTSGVARGLIVSPRFWQETNSRLRRLQDPGSPLSTSPSSRMNVSSKAKRYNSDGPAAASPRITASSPVRGGTRPASPNKLWTPSASSPLRGFSSPLKGRPTNGNSTSTPSILSFAVDLRRGKIGEDRIADAHMLRLLYNRYLQWRFVNARADATFKVQRLNAEKNVWNAWVTISELRHSVTLRRIKLLLLRQKLKLTSILKRQISYLEEWSQLDRDHCSSMEGATEALKASTLRLPIGGKAIADVQNLKDAVGCAVDVMQAMASSICSQSSKVEEMNSLFAEIVNVTTKEGVMLENCKDLLSTLASMLVKDCSLRTHLIQLNRLPTSNSHLTTRV